MREPAKKKSKSKPKDRRKNVRTVHRIDVNTSRRGELLARADLVSFLTKRY